MKNSIIKKLYALLTISVLFIAAAKAQIVYTDVNPDSTVTAVGNQTITYDLDLNNDGTVDFKILTQRIAAYLHGVTLNERVTPLHTNQVLDTLPGTLYFPLALELNRYVGPNLLWRNDSNQRFLFGNGIPGYWSYNNTDAFLGLKLIIGSDIFYGWVRLSIQKNGTGWGVTFSSTIKDYAYNSIPNQPILAGETSCTTPTVNLTQSGPLSFCAGDSVKLTANGTGYQYQWKKGGVNISGATKQTYIAKTGGVYKCKVTNSCGSKTSSGKTVSITCRISNETFTETLEHLSVYPNPATNSVTIKFPSDEAGEIQIVNLFGQIVYSKNLQGFQNLEGLNETQIDVSKFSVGMYVIRWNSEENSETKTFSIVK